MRSELAAALGRLFQTPPQAYAFLYGSEKYPDIHGVVYFYPFSRVPSWRRRPLVFPTWKTPAGSGFSVSISTRELFAKEVLPPPLRKPAPTITRRAASILPMPEICAPFWKRRLRSLHFLYGPIPADEAAGHTVILHELPDDFTTQPSGASGEKIACGEVQMNPVPFTVLQSADIPSCGQLAAYARGAGVPPSRKSLVGVASLNTCRLSGGGFQSKMRLESEEIPPIQDALITISGRAGK